ncbi:unnamed protein product (macronuclear) [Paramecium tetraurelia]|uniref:Uncharacterized protein n=1 Tax=Paramecium tetraurelia TaxID=5888 RepID=A0BHP4_PARTE|nr:uncharacterized protein GSPATT00029097001 [Paramecium tetraurelia]CAK58061.1 unnamed protein product [Paramecium tetraurelia]|eukprot:XP_001425459.1 hypothetical protein (macronuclear) [Paramecium tetraurelia strain d4-2]
MAVKNRKFFACLYSKWGMRSVNFVTFHFSLQHIEKYPIVDYFNKYFNQIFESDMNSLNIENNKFMKRAIQRKSQREISLTPTIVFSNKEIEIDDFDSPTTLNLQIPIFSPTKMIFSLPKSAGTIK